METARGVFQTKGSRLAWDDAPHGRSITHGDKSPASHQRLSAPTAVTLTAQKDTNALVRAHPLSTR
jgi:hypothetical protein